ncbi:MAG: hypothetical protein OXF68_11420 [Gammaproteobacteria bacterium]|nr:hypothetical protein [Gammaproteobacteria bacterium]
MRIRRYHELIDHYIEGRMPKWRRAACATWARAGRPYWRIPWQIRQIIG